MFYFPYTTVTVGQIATAWNALSSVDIIDNGYDVYYSTFGDGTSVSATAAIDAVFTKTYDVPGTYIWSISAIDTTAMSSTSINQVIDVEEEFNVYLLEADTRHINDTLNLPNNFQETKIISNVAVKAEEINYSLDQLQANNVYLGNQLKLYNNNIPTTLNAWYGYAPDDQYDRSFWHTISTPTFNESSSSVSNTITNIQDILIRRNQLGVQLVYTISNNRIQARVDNNWMDTLFDTNSLQRGLTLVSPTALRIGSQQSLFILDTGGNCIYKVKYDPTSKSFVALDRFGNFGSGENQLNNPSDLDVQNTTIVISDTGNQRIIVLDGGFKILATVSHNDWLLDPIVSAKIHPLSGTIWVLSSKGSLYIIEDNNTITNVIYNVNPFGSYKELVFPPQGDIVYILSSSALHKGVTNKQGTIFEYLQQMDTKTTEDFISVAVDDSRRVFVGTNTKILRYVDLVTFINASKEDPTFWSQTDYQIDQSMPVVSWIYQNAFYKMAENLNNLISITDRRIIRFLDFNNDIIKYDALNFLQKDELDYITDDLNLAPNLNEPLSALVVNRGIQLILDKQNEYLDFLKTKDVFVSTPTIPYIIL